MKLKATDYYTVEESTAVCLILEIAEPSEVFRIQNVQLTAAEVCDTPF